MDRIYSLWLIPSGSIYKKFSEIISNLSIKYSSPNFEPHITLIGNIKSRKEDVILKIRQLARIIKPFTIKFNNIDFTDSIHKSLFIKAFLSSDLINTHEKAKQIFNHEEAEYMLHLSLIYGNQPIETKRKIIAEIENNFPKEFTVNSISLFDLTEKDENLWYKVVEYPVMMSAKMI